MGQATIITDATKGTLTNDVSGSDKTVDAILDAVSKGIAQVGSSAAVTFSTSSLTEGTQLFQTRFDSKDWSGDLVAYNLNDDGSVSAQTWSAATELATTAAEDRTIITWAETRVSLFSGILLRQHKKLTCRPVRPEKPRPKLSDRPGCSIYVATAPTKALAA